MLIDCPPSLGLLTLNAMTTVREIFIPLQTEFFALQGMSKLMETVEIVRRRVNPELQVTGIIACMFDRRTNLAHEVLENIRDYFPDKVFQTVIRRNVQLAESPSHGAPIAKYATASRGNKDYMALAQEVLAQEERLRHPAQV
jgi:chromosome partitioning protein